MKYKKPFWAVDQITRETGLVEDVCKCGVGHPNRAFMLANKSFSGVHGCCGCCRQGVTQEGIVAKPTKPQLKRWAKYQADSPKRGYNLTVDKLNESQAKDELCDAMDLIEKMLWLSNKIEWAAQDANYATK